MSYIKEPTKRAKPWLEKQGLILIEGWARDGLTDEQIAKNMGISVATLYNWKNDYLEIVESLKKGKEVIDYEVENALLNNALNGNITAQIFWLKNRKPDKWRDRVEHNYDAGELSKVDKILRSIDMKMEE